jgi:hypothetical protein
VKKIKEVVPLQLRLPSNIHKSELWKNKTRKFLLVEDDPNFGTVLKELFNNE